MHKQHHIMIALALLVTPACAYEEDDEFRLQPDTGGNSGGGTVFNTNAMDEIGFSEITRGPAPSSLTGFYLNDLTLNVKPPIVIADLEVEGGEIAGFDAAHTKYETPAFLSSTWVIGNDQYGDLPPLTLTSAISDGTVARYNFAHKSEDGQLISTCPVGPSGPGTARVLAGFSLNEATGEVTNSPSTLYFACDTGATGKAADLGFYDLVIASGDDEVQDTPLDWTPFETAIRMIRADYCYDGKSYTSPGTAVFVQDKWNLIKPPPNKMQNPIEAVWGADGLICRGKGRQQAIACEEALKKPVCAANTTLDTYEGALFLTRGPEKPPKQPPVVVEGPPLGPPVPAGG